MEVSLCSWSAEARASGERRSSACCFFHEAIHVASARCRGARRVRRRRNRREIVRLAAHGPQGATHGQPPRARRRRSRATQTPSSAARRGNSSSSPKTTRRTRKRPPSRAAARRRRHSRHGRHFNPADDTGSRSTRCRHSAAFGLHQRKYIARATRPRLLMPDDDTGRRDRRVCGAATQVDAACRRRRSTAYGGARRRVATRVKGAGRRGREARVVSDKDVDFSAVC